MLPRPNAVSRERAAERHAARGTGIERPLLVPVGIHDSEQVQQGPEVAWRLTHQRRRTPLPQKSHRTLGLRVDIECVLYSRQQAASFLLSSAFNFHVCISFFLIGHHRQFPISCFAIRLPVLFGSFTYRLHNAS